LRGGAEGSVWQGYKTERPVDVLIDGVSVLNPEPNGYEVTIDGL